MYGLKPRFKKTSIDGIIYHDGKFQTTKSIYFLGHVTPKCFAWNGVTMWMTSDNMILPSMLHDLLLSQGYPRKYCDKEFMKAMKNQKVSFVKRGLFFAIVRTTSIIKRD